MRLVHGIHGLGVDHVRARRSRARGASSICRADAACLRRAWPPSRRKNGECPPRSRDAARSSAKARSPSPRGIPLAERPTQRWSRRWSRRPRKWLPSRRRDIAPARAWFSPNRKAYASRADIFALIDGSDGREEKLFRGRTHGWNPRQLADAESLVKIQILIGWHQDSMKPNISPGLVTLFGFHKLLLKGPYQFRGWKKPDRPRPL